MSWLLVSRRRVIVGVLSLALVLDLSRSIYARTGFATPTTRWEPTPAEYQDLVWPPARAVPAGAPPGQRVYIERCAVCHGFDGRGNGPAAPSLHPKPRDFTRGEYKYLSVLPGVTPTDEELYRIIADGLQASAMPYWRGVLSEAELRAVASYVGAMAKRPAATSVVPSVSIPVRAPLDSASVGRGRQLYASLGCAGCHGVDGRLELRSLDSRNEEIRARDLTAPWTFRGGSAPEQLWWRITAGIAGTPMPSFASVTSASQRWDVVNYVLSLRRTPPWEPGGTFGGPGTARDPIRRGEYLARAEMCGLCHTEINPSGIYRASLPRADERWLAGGMRVGAYPQGVFVSRNLTGDTATGLGGFAPAQIANAIRNGRSPRGDVLNLYGMPWMYLHGLSADDALAIAHFLKTIPPVHNQIPRALHFGVVETIAQKVARGLPQGTPTVLTFAAGDFADTPGRMSRVLPQRLLVWAQWIVLAAGLVGFIFAGPRERRWPGSARGWMKVSGVAVLLLLVWGFGAIAYGTPALALIPPDVIGKQFASSIHAPDTTRMANPQERAMVTRGRYLYTVASCAMCHQGGGQGGWQINWATAFGTVYTRNITTDSATGIGAWRDAEIARAIRGGVSRDGRALHWQGMIWDHASNWDEEDVRALIAYLRRLPPIHNPVGSPRPPTAGDCADYTFWLESSKRPGCS